MCPAEQEPQQQALLEEAQLIGRRALTLSRTLLRCDALVEAGGRELQLLDQDASEEQKRDDAVLAVRSMANTAFTRTDAYFTVALAALYAVVEKWIEWKFADPAVDALLADGEKLRRLRKYRHTIFHADYYDHPDFAAMATDNDLVEWSARLAAPLRAYLKRWHADPASHINTHMQRSHSEGAV
jgi:hypothetical protein